MICTLVRHAKLQVVLGLAIACTVLAQQSAIDALRSAASRVANYTEDALDAVRGNASSSYDDTWPDNATDVYNTTANVTANATSGIWPGKLRRLLQVLTEADEALDGNATEAVANASYWGNITNTTASNSTTLANATATAADADASQRRLLHAGPEEELSDARGSDEGGLAPCSTLRQFRPALSPTSSKRAHQLSNPCTIFNANVCT
jgi:hypothetical protein